MEAKNLKDYYQILGVNSKASSYQIEQAYQKLANQWSPKNNQKNSKQAEKKLKDVSEAFEVLYNRKSRQHYDSIFHRDYSLGDAENTFQSFFADHGFENQNEKKLYNKQFQGRQQAVKNYYEILGIKKGANPEEIKAAYRKLAVKHHPLNNPKDLNAQQKFLEINQAFSTLSHKQKKHSHDQFLQKILPKNVNEIFEQFFDVQESQIVQGEEIFKPKLRQKWSRMLDRMMENEEDNEYINNKGQTVKQASVTFNDGGQKTKKICKIVKKVSGDKVQETKIECYEFPNGEKDFKKTKIIDGKPQIESYHAKSGFPIPIQFEV